MQYGRALAAPFAIQLPRDRGLRGLAAAVVADQADGLEAGRLKAARDAFEHLQRKRVRERRACRETADCRSARR